MAHISQKLCFGGVGAFGGIFGFTQVTLMQHALGHVLHDTEQGGDFAGFILGAAPFTTNVRAG
jgi:hypothetical protein